ncbi:transcriptional repressor TCF25 family protein [Sporobolomyces salmoneus]|uniref:transcriptional repressor TCF25 family protein n=1 Tax=Sporobolomyces salmoneus TaxID=183962 RepID=UPI0031783A8B
MPPRLNKRQLRELQELEELQKSKAASAPGLPTENEVELDEESEEEIAAPTRSAGGFGALDLGDGEDEDEDDGEIDSTTPAKSKKKNKKKKKKPSTVGADSPSVEDSEVAATPAPTEQQTETPVKKNKKKAKAKKPEVKKETKVDDGMDEIDRALAELATKNGGGGAENETVASMNQRIDPKWAAVKEVFAFETKYLDSDAELRRMFGSKVIGNAPTAPRSHLHARFANNPHHSTSIRRSASHLAAPEAGWPSASGTLGLTRYEGPESDADPSGDWHTYVHPPSYKQAQLMFLEVLQQADGNRLFDVLAAQPYHIDTLMQLSEMMTQQGDLGAAATHLSRALYALSTPLPATFPSGNFRLPFSQIENRAFFVGIARQVALHFKRGTWRTAFEFSKIALGTGGGHDPVGMLCWIDFLAPKAGQNDWFLKLLPTLATAYPDMHVESYPGLAFAKALVLRNMEDEKKEDHEKSTEALKSAIIRFPMVATLLSNSLAFDLPPAMVSHRRAQPDGAFTKNPSYLLSLLSELYVARSAPLWKDPASLSWLRKAVTAATPLLDDSSLEDVRLGEKLWSEGAFDEGVAPAGVIRAAFISDIASIRPYLPPSARSGTTYSFDPLPPTSPNATFYDDTYFSSLYAATNSRRRGRNVVQRGPGGGARNGADVAAAMRDGLARMLGIGAGDGAMALTPELREELMRELEMLGGAGGMPGGFGDAEEDEEEDEDRDYDENGEEEGTEEERLENTRNILGRLGALFGGGGGAAAQRDQE